MKNRQSVEADLFGVEEMVLELREEFDSEKSDDSLYEKIATIKEFINCIAMELDLEDEMNARDYAEEQRKNKFYISAKTKVLKDRSSLLEKIEKEYAEIEKRLVECVSGFEFILDESSTIKDLTLNRTYSLGSDKLQLLTDDLNALKQKLKQAEMMEDVYRSLEE